MSSNRFILSIIILSTIYFNHSSGKYLRMSKTNEENQREDDACRTKDNREGKCLPFAECPELQNLLDPKNGVHPTPGVASFLKGRACRPRGKELRFCCLTNITRGSPEEPTSSEAPALQLAPMPPMEDSELSILPSKNICGKSFGTRISRGQFFEHGSHPWLVGIGVPQGKNGFKVDCGGTLITNRHVLTAAHCFEVDANEKDSSSHALTHVILGEHDLTSNAERIPPVTRKIARRITKGYNNISRENDIEILVLDQEVTFNPFIAPACLPTTDDIKNFNISAPFVIAGWGKETFGAKMGTNTPLEARINLVPKSDCREAYSFDKGVPIHRTMICLGGNGRDTCQGDSGGPLLFEDMKSNRYFLMGITSFGVDCGNDKYPGVYTYVPPFMDWIIENLKSN